MAVAKPTNADEGAGAGYSAELAETLDRIEKDMNELRAAYELYFMGIEKLEPAIQREKIKSEIRRLKDHPSRNTALRFRAQSLKARMVSLENYWTRVNRQREDGTYHRDLDKVRRREMERERKEKLAALRNPEKAAAERAAAEKAAAEKAATEKAARGAPPGRGPAPVDRATTDLDGRRGPAPTVAQRPAPSEGQAIAPSRREAPASLPPREGTAVARPSARTADDLTEPKLRQLYSTYVQAKKRCGEKVDVRFEDMAASLKKQVPKLMQSTGAKEVEFKVVIKSGKAVLKAVPKT